LALSVTNLGIDGVENVEQIGTGGSSRVYRARQVDLDRVVAIKVLNPGDDQGVAKRFDRERKAMGRLSLHEGIVPVYSSGVTAHGEPYLVMPYYANGSLQDQIDAGPMEWETAVSYVDVAAETIAAAHEEGVVHLDLKPANILLTNTGAPRIADFGIARLTGVSTAGITAGTAFTPAYSAPETFLDGETGPPSDVYGLGATLWALLVGHPPFLTPGDDANLMAVIGRVVNNRVGDLRHIAPAAICDVIERAMAKRPGDRHQSAREFSQALKQAAAGASVGFVPPPAQADRGTALFPGVVTAHDPAGAAFPPGNQVGPVQADFPGPADPVTTSAPRTLLQETARPLPTPVHGPPAGAPAPFIDLDRFRVGPLLLGVVAFLVIVGAAAFAFYRQPDGAIADDVGDETVEPAGPEAEEGTTLSVGGTGTTSIPPSTSTTTETGDSTTVTVSTTTGPSTSGGPSTTSESTTTTEESTTTEEATTTSQSTTTTSASTTTQASTTTVATGPPRAPTGLTAAVAANGSDVQLSWNAPAAGPEPAGYVVLRNGSAIRNNLARTTFVDRNLDARTYTYTVRAIGDDGSLSPTSNSATVTVGPVAITAFSVNRSSGERVSVSFSANRCVTYRISVVSAGGNGDPAPVIGPDAGCTDARSVIIGELDPTTDYQVNLTVIHDDERASAFKEAPAPDAG
jgi:tRNA A-37 threonylcarbamoyl transferase component Bud32